MPADTPVKRMSSVRVEGGEKEGKAKGITEGEPGDATNIMNTVSAFHSQVGMEKLDLELEVGVTISFSLPARYLLSQINLQQSILMMLLQRSVGNKPKAWVLPR